MKYFDKIDGRRCVAISLVIIEHFAFFFGKHITAGFFGVDLFFVISGFLITTILLRPNEKSFGANYKNFVGRRTLRIFPIYYLTVAIIWLLHLDIARKMAIWLWTYTFNFAAIKFDLPNSPVGHFWSLCVEEQFYLCWPFVVLLLRKRWQMIVVISLGIVAIGYAELIFNAFTASMPVIALGLLARIAPLGLGALGAVLASRNLLPDRLLRNRRFEILVFSLLILSMISPFRIRFFIMDVADLYLVLKASIYGFNLAPVERFLTKRQVIRIGKISYGIYVYHLVMAYYFTNYVFNPIWFRIPFDSLGKFSKLQWNSWIIKLPLYFLLSIGVAWLSFNYLEKPILKLKDRLFKY